MSRTKRKEDPSITSWDVEYRNVFTNPTYDCSFEDGKLIYTYREKTKKEIVDDILCNTIKQRRSPSRWYRHRDIKKIRTRTKRELRKYLDNNAYEPIIPKKNLDDVWWNWD